MTDKSAARARRVLIILNPAAGRRRGRLLRASLRALAARGIATEIQTTRRAGEATEMARAAIGRFDTVVAAGGDGTIHEIVNGLAGSNVAFAILPLGTANILAHSIGLARRAETVAETIARGEIQSIKLGRSDGKYFALMVSCGPDARVVRDLDIALKRATGRFAYGWATLLEFFHYRPVLFEAEIDGAVRRGYWIIVANQRFHAGPYTVAPDADLARGKLQIVLMQSASRWAMLRFGLALFCNRLARQCDVAIVAADRIVLRAVAGEPVQADGEWIGVLPMTIDLAPASINLCMPAKPDQAPAIVMPSTRKVGASVP